MKKISVLMSTYNEPLDWLEKAIQSILTQTYTTFEFIIVCDNPENQTLVQYLHEKSHEDSRIRLIINEKNIGLADSLNEAYQASTGDYIARMDADDIAYPNRFLAQLQFIEENPSIDLLCGNVGIINESGKIIQPSRMIEYTSEQLNHILQVGNVLMHPTFFMTREAFEKVGSYRPFPAAEDYDFILRALTQGLILHQFKETVLEYRVRETSMSYGNALVSQLSTSYILTLYQERKETGKDSFNLNEITQIKQVDPKEKAKFSDVLYRIRVTYKGNKIMKGLASFEGLFRSKYFRKYFLSMLRVSQTIKKYSR